MKIGFRITDGKGFSIAFDNGYSVSVQFGPGNYADNYDAEIRSDNEVCGKRGSMTAECAVIDPEGILIGLPGIDDTVTNRSTPDEVLGLMNWAAQLVPDTSSSERKQNGPTELQVRDRDSVAQCGRWVQYAPAGKD